MDSFRFFPVWNKNDICQTVGFLELINHVLSDNRTINSWVEIGSYIGESATILLGFPQIKHLSCIDTNKDHCNFLLSKLAVEISIKRCKIINKRSDLAYSDFTDESIDVLYIDGNHSYNFVYNDIVKYFPKIKCGGFLTGHDYNDSWPGVKKAVDQFLENYNYNTKNLVLFRDSSWLIKK